MKGIILAGGAGSRLYPLTQAVSKQLHAVFDKPMVYYPLTTLIECGIREICLISTRRDLPAYRELLGTGGQFGISLQYVEQPRPGGLPEAFILAESFIARSSVTLILGDNIFADSSLFARAVSNFRSGATIFAQYSQDPDRYGVVELDESGAPLSLEEKPTRPRSNYVVPGLYLYDGTVSDAARKLRRSERGELEISDLNAQYLSEGKLKVQVLPPGFFWIDAGTALDLHRAAAYVETRQATGGKLGCPEEAALRKGLISNAELRGIVGKMPKCEYRAYLERLLE